MKQTKPSELFEGNNSTLKQAFDESVSHISHTNINDTRIGSKKPVDWKNQYPLNTLSGTTKQEFEEFIEGLLSMQNTSNVGKNDYKEVYEIIKEIPLIKIHKEVLTEVGLYWTIQETVGELITKALNKRDEEILKEMEFNPETDNLELDVDKANKLFNNLKNKEIE